MIREQFTDIHNFFIVGVNYKKTDASLRGRFSINSDQYTQLLASAASYGISELFVLSTCNRTEIYGIAPGAGELAALLCSQTEGSKEEFSGMAYSFRGTEAIGHLFHVAAGLDSQILGDYEIVGQIRQAAKFSRQHECIGPFMERLVNEVLSCCKDIRTNTGLSSGTVSVSFAAVQYCKLYAGNSAGNNILLIGTGKIGSNTCKNLVDYLPGTSVTLMNRTEEKAAELAAQFGIRYAAMDDLQSCIENADIIVVATNSDSPVISTHHLTGSHGKLVIDLSVPCNVDPVVAELAGIKLVNVDELSKIKDETLLKRSAEIPKTKAIIAQHISFFIDWHEMRKFVPVLKAVKTQLKKIHNLAWQHIDPAPLTPMCEKTAEEKIQKVINGMAVKMRVQNQRGCQYIEAMNAFMATGSD
jgi:glutamyl-tRNA reductase